MFYVSFFYIKIYLQNILLTFENKIIEYSNIIVDCKREEK